MKTKFKVPHTYVILFAIITIAAIATYIIPAGEYMRVQDISTGRSVVDVESFQYIESTPVSFFELFKSIPKGLQAAGSIVFFVFILGGCFQIVQGTGAIEAGISKTIKKLSGKDKLVIPILMFLFSVLGFTIGASEEVIPFIPITIALAKGLGYDDIVGVAIVSTGACIGFAGGMLNPFTVGIAQGISQLPLYSGLWYRTIGYVIFYVIAVAYVMRYANKIKKDPTKSITYDPNKKEEKNDSQLFNLEFTVRHKLVLTYCLALLSVMVYGIIQNGWYIEEISAIFIIMALGSGIVGKLSANEMATMFVDGAKGIAFGALVIGIARTILVVMQSGQIMDTIIFVISQSLKELPKEITAAGMFVMQSLINFFIPSGSGQAATVMPVMAPLADVVGITRQTAVLAFQYGDALTNQVIPTSGTLLATLGIANISYDKWVKYNWKLICILSLAAMALIVIASTINLGPF